MVKFETPSTEDLRNLQIFASSGKYVTDFGDTTVAWLRTVVSEFAIFCNVIYY